MSRLFKVEQCVESAPCILELVAPVFPEKQANIKEPAEVEEPAVNEPSGDPADLIEDLLGEARIQADALVRVAQKKADEVLTSASTEAEKIREEAYCAAFEAGTKAAREKVRLEMAANLEKAVAILNETELMRAERMAASEPELLKLAGAIAQKIVAQELRLDTEVIRNIVGNALAKVAGAARIKIRIHPDDLEALSANNGLDFETVLGEPKPIRFEADPVIARGGCFIETEMGDVDARIKVQMETIMTELLKVGRFS